MYFITIGSLKRAKRMSWCRVSRLTTVATQREGKRRTIAYMDAISVMVHLDTNIFLSIFLNLIFLFLILTMKRHVTTFT